MDAYAELDPERSYFTPVTIALADTDGTVLVHAPDQGDDNTQWVWLPESRIRTPRPSRMNAGLLPDNAVVIEVGRRVTVTADYGDLGRGTIYAFGLGRSPARVYVHFNFNGGGDRILRNLSVPIPYIKLVELVAVPTYDILAPVDFYCFTCSQHVAAGQPAVMAGDAFYCDWPCRLHSDHPERAKETS